MTANAIAFGVLACLAATTLILALDRRRRLGARSVGAGLLIGVMLTLMFLPMVAHACERGQPWEVILLSSCCAGMLLACTRTPAAWPVALIVVASGLSMGMAYSHLVHQPGYTGNPAYARARPRMLRRNNQYHIEHALARRFAGETYPAGWLAESPLVRTLSPAERADAVRQCRYTGVRTAWFWHTAFTGLYREVPDQRYALWYPGGPVESGLSRMEWRVEPVHDGAGRAGVSAR